MEQNLVITLVQQSLEDSRAIIESLATGIGLFLTFTGVSAVVAFSDKVSAVSKGAITRANIAFAIALALFGFLCAASYSSTIDRARVLIENPALHASLPNPHWIFGGTIVLAVCSIGIIALVWWPALRSSSHDMPS